MSKKSKGINGERDLVHKFWQCGGWCAVRVAGSGSMKYPSADILASNKLRRVAIECKITKENKKYFSIEEIEQLKRFSDFYGAESWLAVKFNRSPWFFVSLDDLESTKRGFAVSIDLARTKGFLFEEFIESCR